MKKIFALLWFLCLSYCVHPAFCGQSNQSDFPWIVFFPAIFENAEDCNGTWGGDAVVDECGVCGGDGTPCPVASPNLISPTDGSGFSTCGGSTSVKVSFKWEPVVNAISYNYVIWSDYPHDTYADKTHLTQKILNLDLILESGNSSAKWYWKVQAVNGTVKSEFSDVYLVKIGFSKIPCL